jgi:hypothetical protein
MTTENTESTEKKRRGGAPRLSLFSVLSVSSVVQFSLFA